jgi:flavin-dependent dehydrogenase
MSLVEKNYDIGIVGGGLGGLSLSILLRRMGHTVVLFEKEAYPFHRVCGEYISRESEPFLRELGIDIDALALPKIDKLEISSPKGLVVKHNLTLGGIGISRFLLDELLFNIAKEEGVEVNTSDKVSDIKFNDNQFTIQASSGNYNVRAAVASSGKKSNLDIKWQRPFIQQKPNKLNNYIGVKYHIKTDFPLDTIALHNFKDGYCGMSAIEDGKYCLCYLTTAANLKQSGNTILEMEKTIIQENPFLKKVFQESEFLISEPVVISQVSFQKKALIENHVIMIGDSAGMITPLCGNGMSMAMHSSKIASKYIHQFLLGDIQRETLEKSYFKHWNKQFSNRLRIGRSIQAMFGKPLATEIFLKMLKPFPKLVGFLVKQTHGKPF